MQSGSQSLQRPSQGELSSFLDMSPPTPAARPERPASASPRATSQAPTSSGDGIQTKTFETDRGGTVTIGGGSGSSTTTGGATIGGAGAGVKVETAGGQTYVKGVGAAGATDGDKSAVAAGSRTGIETASGATAGRATSVRAATDGTNTAVRAGSAAGIQDAAGNTAVNVRGGYADSSGYRQGGSVTAAKTEGGAAAVHARGGYGDGSGTGQVGSLTAVRGPEGNAAAVGRRVGVVNGVVIGSQQAVAVRAGFTGYRTWYTPAYYARYRAAWYVPGIAATAWWLAPAWGSTYAYCGCAAEPTSYSYGDTITYEGDTVYYNNQPAATAEQYQDQASQIADSVRRRRTRTGCLWESSPWSPKVRPSPTRFSNWP